MSAHPDTKDVLFDLAAFQVAWLALVLGTANDLAGVGQSVAAAAITVHLLRALSLDVVYFQ